MSTPERPIVFDPERLAKHFSVLQPARGAVQSKRSALPECCLRTALRLWTRGPSARPYVLTLPAAGRQGAEAARPALVPSEEVMTAGRSGPVLQVLMGSEAVTGRTSALYLQAEGPAHCPPGQDNLVQVFSPGGESIVRTVPFNSWLIPLRPDPDFVAPADRTDFPKGPVHPFRLPDLPAARWRVAVPACGAVSLAASVAVFPEVSWQGGVQVRARADPGSPTGARLELVSDAECVYGAGRRRIQSWEEAVAWCPWLGCLETLTKSVAALETLRPDRRFLGWDHARLARAGEIAWKTWPQCRVALKAGLNERSDSGLLGYSTDFSLEADPLLAGSGEWSLLPPRLADPNWRERLAPLLVGTRGGASGPELAQELGLWLTVDGELGLQVRHEENRPGTSPRTIVRPRGEIRVGIEGRSLREYEGIVVRAGSARGHDEHAAFTIACEAPPEGVSPVPSDRPCRARVAFGGLALRSVEKHRPGIRVRGLPEFAPAPAGASAVAPAELLLPRAWPQGAETAMVDVPWAPP